MAEKTIAQKLLVKEGRKVLFVNSPEGYLNHLGELPQNVTVLQGPVKPADIIQVFVKDRQELESQLANLKKMLSPGGILWVTYYKGTSKFKTDIHRDSINAYAHTLGLEGVAMISIDQDWSALRLKVVS